MWVIYVDSFLQEQYKETSKESILLFIFLSENLENCSKVLEQ